ncbi:fatty alcohol:caffeoyl-CoA acyltransferase-like [Cucurbita pepo subsp. pepo]|uniref:fatty alcohol:caffeoyl-CoA acyltransferase-like n=1 Tax=Cucurbita pepo subsp. pepo TaxID=3664 RepID=UPI000C9D6C11|nr:fatty alcohol:caffeoyl-CoA acyltransferase-like [Cucurbita pepo subsp. pepo]
MAEGLVIKREQLPKCEYRNDPVLIKPITETPKHILPLSDVDDQAFLRFSIKCVLVFRGSMEAEWLKCGLSRVLVDYYPLAGRLRTCPQHLHKLQVDCNGEGALFAEAFLDVHSHHFLSFTSNPDASWSTLLYKPKVDALNFAQLPPLLLQVTYLRCGGMILSTAIHHCLCDGIGTSQFLHAWAHITSQSNLSPPLTPPFHSRHVLSHRDPTRIHCAHPQYTKTPRANWDVDITKSLQSQPLVPSSSIFTTSQILRLKPSFNCTTFETLASHTWRSWIRSLDLPPSLHVKLLFPVNIRNKLVPKIPKGYYGNAFVLGCAESSVNELTVAEDLNGVVRLVQNAKSIIDDDYIKSTIFQLEDKSLQADLSASLVISDWSKLGLQDLDFGLGKPLVMSPLSSDVFCLFLPVIGDIKAVRVLVSVPVDVVEKFEYYMTGEYFSDGETNV